MSNVKYMTNETLLYYYERTRKQQAKVLVFNMLLLPFILWLFLQLTRENEAVYEQFLVYVKYIIVFAELVLLSLVIWFLANPAKFYIKLTNYEFSSLHPNFKAWTFSVNPNEIVEIEQSTDREAQSSIISVKLINGSSYSLSPNYAYSRKKLYQALRLANPNIKIPKNTWLFSYKR